MSLAGALEEYLKDPNFEQNRLEYRANKAAADGNQSAPLKSKDTKGRDVLISLNARSYRYASSGLLFRSSRSKN